MKKTFEHREEDIVLKKGEKINLYSVVQGTKYFVEENDYYSFSKLSFLDRIILPFIFRWSKVSFPPEIIPEKGWMCRNNSLYLRFKLVDLLNYLNLEQSVRNSLELHNYLVRLSFNYDRAWTDGSTGKIGSAMGRLFVTDGYYEEPITLDELSNYYFALNVNHLEDIWFKCFEIPGVDLKYWTIKSNP